MSRRPILPQNQMLQEFAKYHGKPNPTRNKRALVLKANPLHYSFGEVRPVWKTYLTYAQNMGLLETDYEQS